MSVGKRPREIQHSLFVTTGEVKGPAHPFYDRLNELLREAGFDLFVEELVAEYYSNVGRRGLAPGIFFRMLLIGYFEGLASDRGIDWKCADSLSLRRFLGIPLEQSTPDHSTLCKTRQRLPVEVHDAVFQFVLEQLATAGLLKGEGIAIDASLLHANASLASLVHNETGETYQEFLTRLAIESGIPSPTKADLKRIDKQRKANKKSSNEDWHNPHDPDAKIKKTPRDGTKMTYKVEHAVDTASGAILGAAIHLGNVGDTTSGIQTLELANEALGKIIDACPNAPLPGNYIAADKGYHSDATLLGLEACGFEPVISEKKDNKNRDFGKNHEAQAANVRNRKRRQSEVGQRLRRTRAEYAERSFAHTLHRGDLRKTYLRGRSAIQKRWFVHTAAFNLGLLMRHHVGIGTPRRLQDMSAALLAIFALLFALWSALRAANWSNSPPTRPSQSKSDRFAPINEQTRRHWVTSEMAYSSTAS